MPSHVCLALGICICLWFIRVILLPACTLSKRSASKRVRSYMHNATTGMQLVPNESFALITGATGSIGMAFAKYLAKEGYSLILTGRTRDALDQVAKVIAESYPKITVVTVICDLSNNESIYSLTRTIDEKDIAILVNNAGAINLQPDDVSDLSADSLQNIVMVNVQGTTLLTRLLIPKLKSRKNSLIVFMGSINGSLPCPMVTCYSASKAYTHAFAIGLREELKVAEVTVVAAAPAWIASNMTLRTRTSLLFISPEHFVRCFFRARWTSTVVNPYYWHSVMESILRLLPECLRTKYQYSQLTNIRFKIKRKLEKSR